MRPTSTANPALDDTGVQPTLLGSLEPGGPFDRKMCGPAIGKYGGAMSNTTANGGLRAKERVIKRLSEDGMSASEIAWRFKSSPGHIHRTLRLIEVPSGTQDTSSDRSGASAIERTVTKARTRGVTHAEIGARLRRSPAFVARVEELAALRVDLGFA